MEGSKCGADIQRGSRGVASNYRPVSLTSQISKVFESIIRDEMVNFFEKYGVIKETQHGFRTVSYTHLTLPTNREV